MVGAAVTSATLTGLTNGITYTVSVTAVNAANLSSGGNASTSATVRPLVQPGAPKNAALSNSAKNILTLTWQAPDSTTTSALPSGYVIQSSNDGIIWGSEISVDSATSSYAFTVGNPDGSKFFARVLAISSAGRSGFATVAANRGWTPEPVSNLHITSTGDHKIGRAHV